MNRLRNLYYDLADSKEELPKLQFIKVDLGKIVKKLGDASSQEYFYLGELILIWKELLNFNNSLR